MCLVEFLVSSSLPPHSCSAVENFYRTWTVQCDLTAIYALGILDADEHSHKVLHRMLKRKDDGTPNYFTYCVDFASPYVAENVYLTVQKKEQQRLMSFLRGSDGDSHLATLRGTLFEQKAHELLSKGGTFKIRELART